MKSFSAHLERRRGRVEGGAEAGAPAALYDADRGDHATDRRGSRRQDVARGVQQHRLIVTQ